MVKSQNRLVNSLLDGRGSFEHEKKKSRLSNQWFLACVSSVCHNIGKSSRLDQEGVQGTILRQGNDI